MRTYIIGKEELTVRRGPSVQINEDEISVTSREELHQACSVAKGFWHYGILCPVSRSGEGLDIANG
jgi:hypothetical protein